MRGQLPQEHRKPFIYEAPVAPQQGWAAVYPILEHAREAMEARYVSLAHVDRETAIVRIVALAGPRSQGLLRARTALRKIFPDFSLPGVSFSAAANAFARAAYVDGRVVNAPIEELALGFLRPQVIAAAIRFGGFKYGVVCPVKDGDRVLGAVVFHTRKPFDTEEVADCQKLVEEEVVPWRDWTLVRVLNEEGGHRAKPSRTDTAQQVLQFGNITIDTESGIPRVDKRRVALTRFEFDLLKYLMLRPRQVIPVEELMDKVFGTSGDSIREIADLTISHLRTKLEADGSGRVIHSVRGKGYVLREGRLP
ncbi:MAG: winged helix-turn-helix transcriptional regulator [SAR202 cluster bacterium]|nr:winged helix-turn-helix transcriptional regulator [SAR202 cluster bacterium]